MNVQRDSNFLVQTTDKWMITDMKANAYSQHLQPSAKNLEKELLSVADKKFDDYPDIKKMLAIIVKNDEKLESEETFKSLIKAFTSQCLYGHIGKVMFNANYSRL